VFLPLLDAERLVFTQFFARAGTKPCKLQHFLPFLNRFFALNAKKNAGIYAFFKKSKIVT